MNTPLTLKTLSNENLLSHAQALCATERKITAQIIEMLEEVERRKLYLELGFSSLFSFCVESLSYSASAAQRRISSMRTIKDFGKRPKEKIKEKLRDGRLNLSKLSEVSQAIRVCEEQNQKQVGLKKTALLLEKVEKKTSAETRGILARELGISLAQRETFQVGQNHRSEKQARLSLTLDEETLDLLQNFKNLSAAQNPRGDTAKALKLALKLGLERLEEKRGIKSKEQMVALNERDTRVSEKKTKTRDNKAVKRTSSQNAARKPQTSNANAHFTSASEVRMNRSGSFETLARSHSKTLRKQIQHTRYIPKTIRQQVWARDQGKCQFVSSKAGRPCGSSYRLELDHRHPHALGGPNTLSNLRLLCANHNRNNGRQVLAKLRGT